MNIKKPSSNESRIAQAKSNARETDEECLQLHVFFNNATVNLRIKLLTLEN